MRFIKSLMVVLEKYQIIEQLDGQYADQVKLKTQHGFAVGMFLKVGREVARRVPSDKMLCAHAGAL